MVTIAAQERNVIGSLMEKVLSYRNIHLAYLRTKSNYMNKELQNHHEIELFNRAVPNIYEDIKLILKGEKEYILKPLEFLNKPKKKEEDKWITRPIVRINFFDSVIIQSVINVLAEELRYMLPSTNFGYRLNSVNSSNIYQYWKYGYSKFVNKEIELAENEKYQFVVEADIQNFYPSVDKTILIDEIKTVVSRSEEDKNFFDWIDKVLNLKVVTEDGEINELQGLPQGPLFSPLFALFYIRKYLDKIKKEFPNIVGFSYVDDIRIYCETEEEAQGILEELSFYMECRGLELNQDKSGIFKTDTQKKFEAKIMGRASNLDRAIRDEVIISSKDKEEMRERLTLLMKELSESNMLGNVKKEKLEERLCKFVDYRIVKLLDDDEGQWNVSLNENTDIGTLSSNFTAMWHALYLSASSYKQKLNFLNSLENLLQHHSLEELSYVKYIIHSYLFRWSPYELKYSEEKITRLLESCLSGNSYIMVKALLINIHPDWINYLKDYIEVLKGYPESEMKNLLYNLNLIPETECIYNDYFYDKRLFFEGSNILKYTSNTFDVNEKYLEKEVFKSINYSPFNNNNGQWNCEVDLIGKNIKEVSLSDYEAREILSKLAKWLDIQFHFSEDRIPCSVVNPDYIYIGGDNLFIYGNPAYREDIFYYNSPNNVWRQSLIELMQVLFGIDPEKGIDIFNNTKTIAIWQYRIIRKLYHKIFDVKDFVDYVLKVVIDEDSYTPVSYEQIGLDKVLNHYIKDFNSLDNLLLISQFVENSWKNGAKECNFYTLHNHEHARYLISNIHELLKKSDFSIYLNSKEAFRLFAACYLHDIGMLSAPEEAMLINIARNDVKGLSSKVGNILGNPFSKEMLDKRETLKLPFIYDLHSEVEKLREGIVRDEHPFVSEKELVSDYPKLPLSVAERRDIGIISSAHGKLKSKIGEIMEVLHDGSHPIRLKLISLLLRLADLTDVSKERVRREILERNHARMDNVSIFHWIKHLSVDNLEIKTIRNEDLEKPTIVQLTINHNYLPIGNLEKNKLQEVCGSNCKFKLKDDGLEDSELNGFYKEGKKRILEKDGSFKYFKDSNCDLTCAFVNKSYNWFFAEVVYLNIYLEQQNINVQFDLNIKLDEKANRDFYYVYNRNEKYTAQEFMHEFFS